MTHIWTILCEKSSVDFESNLLSLFNCIEEMNLVVDKTKMVSNKKIIIPVALQVVSFWSIKDDGKENSSEIRIDFIDPKQQVLSSYNNTIKAKKGVKRIRNRINIQGIPVTESGRYYYRVSQKVKGKFKTVFELPLDVNLSYKINDK